MRGCAKKCGINYVRLLLFVSACEWGVNILGHVYRAIAN